ncbi:MAG: hypothetical protein ABIC91_01205 [Nanoarchaeota archaeon]|nr:hypothetical protein [Nanoarchaeota archaeon]MBU1029822.1 hypothetical protein [Nanoarchaeota archaeon]MBU1849651.1 hypothetical protein [Nanoarchaeota archaeon]
MLDLNNAEISKGLSDKIRAGLNTAGHVSASAGIGFAVGFGRGLITPFCIYSQIKHCHDNITNGLSEDKSFTKKIMKKTDYTPLMNRVETASEVAGQAIGFGVSAIHSFTYVIVKQFFGEGAECLKFALTTNLVDRGFAAYKGLREDLKTDTKLQGFLKTLHLYK